MQLTMTQATELVGVSRQTIYAWINEGILPYEQKGYFRLINKVDLLSASEIMANRLHGGTARGNSENK